MFTPIGILQFANITIYFLAITLVIGLLFYFFMYVGIDISSLVESTTLTLNLTLPWCKKLEQPYRSHVSLAALVKRVHRIGYPV